MNRVETRSLSAQPDRLIQIDPSPINSSVITELNGQGRIREAKKIFQFKLPSVGTLRIKRGNAPEAKIEKKSIPKERGNNTIPRGYYPLSDWDRKEVGFRFQSSRGTLYIVVERNGVLYKKVIGHNDPNN